MNRLVKTVALTSLCIGTQAYALNDGFNFDECSGSGSFEQEINHYGGDYENAIEVGQIPTGIQGLRITLESDRDVDIRLTAGEDKIVHWPYGLLNKSTQEHTDFEGTTVTYSGYNGVDGEQGHEFIEVDGTISRTMTMQAFGYKAGHATVNYSWTGTEGCEAGTGTGDGTFTQEIRKKQIVMVGRIPTGIKDLQVALSSDNDLDIQLYGEDGTAIVAWPGGLLAGATTQELEHHGVTIEWSGYNGDGTNKGHEYIKITGRTNEVLTMKAYGYESGLAEVSYSWDANTTREDDNTTQEETAMQTLMNTLAYMGNEERLAYDVYNNLFDVWGTKQFTNIANNSEIKHIQAVQQLVQTYKVDDMNFTNIDMPPLGYKDTAVTDMEAGVYDIAKIQKLYDDLVAAGSVSEEEALKVGCTVEVVDVTDLDAYILLAQEANASDIVETFTSLRSGSYTHYWSFDNGLKNMGLNNGCCTWSTLCHPEYPQTEENNTTQGEDANETEIDDSEIKGNKYGENNITHGKDTNETEIN
jgi:hypothetical protein